MACGEGTQAVQISAMISDLIAPNSRLASIASTYWPATDKHFSAYFCRRTNPPRQTTNSFSRGGDGPTTLRYSAVLALLPCRSLVFAPGQSIRLGNPSVMRLDKLKCTRISVSLRPPSTKSTAVADGPSVAPATKPGHQ